MDRDLLFDFVSVPSRSEEKRSRKLCAFLVDVNSLDLDLRLDFVGEEGASRSIPSKFLALCAFFIDFRLDLRLDLSVLEDNKSLELDLRLDFVIGSMCLEGDLLLLRKLDALLLL